MTNPAASLTAATAVGAGTTVVLVTPAVHNTMQVTFTGAPALVVVNLEGSLDGANWFLLGVFDSRSKNPTQVSPGLVSNRDQVVSQLRANLVALQGGTSPTVSASIASI